jgi:hypothetical protein
MKLIDSGTKPRPFWSMPNTWLEWVIIVLVLIVVLSVLIPGFPININPSPPREVQQRMAK